MKEIIDYNINEIKTKDDLLAVVNPMPVKNRNKIIRFFKTGEKGPIGFTALKDPVTGKVYTTGNQCYTKDGYSWGSAIPYLFEKYNIKLNDEFIRKFNS